MRVGQGSDGEVGRAGREVSPNGCGITSLIDCGGHGFARSEIHSDEAREVWVRDLHCDPPCYVSLGRCRSPGRLLRGAKEAAVGI